MSYRDLKILGSGRYQPAKKVTAEELDQKLNLRPGTCLKKTGVAVRYYVKDETLTDMGVIAAQKALKKAGLELKDVDAIICAANGKAQTLPCMAARFLKALGGSDKTPIPSFDINSTCLSFVTALDQISYSITAGQYKRVLIISSEIASTGINYNQMESACLFGDGAAAFVIEKGTEGDSRILSSYMETYADGYDSCQIKAGGLDIPPWQFTPETEALYRFDMDGPVLFKKTYEKIGHIVGKTLEKANLSMKDIDYVIPHQASQTAINLLRRKLRIPKEKLHVNVHERGNLIAASIPTCLDEALEDGKLKKGDKVMLLGTSAGLSIQALILTI